DGRAARNAQAGARVLMVDDDSDVRAVALDGLESLGCKVIPAENGRSALAVLASDRPIDLLIVDIRMAGMNGLELIEHARALRPTLKMAVMTGYADGGELLSRLGEIAVLRKPFRVADLAHL